jgi:hypothetical protein
VGWRWRWWSGGVEGGGGWGGREGHACDCGVRNKCVWLTAVSILLLRIYRTKGGGFPSILSAPLAMFSSWDYILLLLWCPY